MALGETTTIDTRRRQRGRFLGFLVLLIGCCAVSNFAMRPLMEMFRPSDVEASFVFAAMGAVAAEFAFVAIWGVLGPGRWTKRLGASLGLAAMLFSCWAFGTIVAARLTGVRRAHQYFLDDIITGFACLPLLLLAIQLPLWTLRIWFRWKIEREQTPRVTLRSDRMSVRSILLLTAVFGISLKLARLASERDEFLMSLLLAAALAMLAILLFIVPLLVIVLRSARPWRNLLIGASCLAATIFLIFIGLWLSHSWSPPGVAVLQIGSIFTGFFSPLLVALLLARREGFRLRWERATVSTVDA